MKSTKFPILSSLLTIILFFASIEINAQIAGSPDTSFGSGGFVATHLTGFASPHDMIIQPDKKIIVVGLGFRIARFNENGTLDTTFSDDGINDDLNIPGQVRDVELLPNGKIMIGGFTPIQASDRFFIARLNSDGSMDTTFDTDGIVQTTIGYASTVESLQILPDGKILAVGWTVLANPSDKDIAMVKYNPDGSLDTAFATNGRSATDFDNLDEFANDSVIQADGKIIVAGYYVDPLPNQYVAAIYRFNPNGSLDTSFGTNGRVSRPGSSYARADHVAIQPDGKIIITGYGIPAVRYNSNGTHDIDFNTPAFTSTWAVAVQSNGKIFVRGTNASNTDVIVRYSKGGTPEVIYTIGATNGENSYYPPAISIAPDGKIVTVGTRLNNNFELVLARFLNLPSVGSMDFDGDFRTDISIFRPSTGEWWYQKSSNGGNGAFQFGAETDKLVPGDYTGDGKTDAAVFKPVTSEWFILRSENQSYYSFPFGASGDIPTVGDFDSDGIADAAIFRPSTGTWFIRRSSDGGATIQQFGQNGDVPVVSDYDGDGKSDIAIYRVALGEWWIQRSTAGLIAFQFGNSTDKPTQGDYTGDGKADVALFRPSTGEWFVLRSENQSYYSFPFGTNGDIPAPGDYDGDGKFDATVSRPSTNTWYVQRTTGGTLIQSFGQSGDVPVPNAFVP